MFLGIDIGGTFTDMVIYDRKFEHYKTIESSKIKDLSTIAENLRVKAVGIGIAAWIKMGRIVKAPNLRILPNLSFQVPYVIENDANCFSYFASRVLDVKNLFGITIGTGIGGGIVIDGKIYRGLGISGEIGHIYVGGGRICSCGGRGHLEAYFGGKAFGDAKSLVESGKVYKLRSFKMFCKVVGAAIMLLNPEVVAFGGRIGGRLRKDMLESNICKYISTEHKPEFHVVRDDLSVAKGAALLASSNF